MWRKAKFQFQIQMHGNFIISCMKIAFSCMLSCHGFMHAFKFRFIIVTLYAILRHHWTSQCNHLRFLKNHEPTLKKHLDTTYLFPSWIECTSYSHFLCKKSIYWEKAITLSTLYYSNRLIWANISKIFYELSFHESLYETEKFLYMKLLYICTIKRLVYGE